MLESMNYIYIQKYEGGDKTLTFCALLHNQRKGYVSILTLLCAYCVPEATISELHERNGSFYRVKCALCL